MPDRSSRCNRPARCPVRGSSRSSYRRLASGSGATFFPSSFGLVRQLLLGAVEFDAKSIERHGQHGVAADREDVVHPLAVVEALAEHRPGVVGQLGLLVEFVDSGQYCAIECVEVCGATVAAAANRGDLVVSYARFVGQFDVVDPFIGAVPTMSDTQD